MRVRLSVRLRLRQSTRGREWVGVRVGVRVRLLS